MPSKLNHHHHLVKAWRKHKKQERECESMCVARQKKRKLVPAFDQRCSKKMKEEGKKENFVSFPKPFCYLSRDLNIYCIMRHMQNKRLHQCSLIRAFLCTTKEVISTILMHTKKSWHFLRHIYINRLGGKP